MQQNKKTRERFLIESDQTDRVRSPVDALLSIADQQLVALIKILFKI